MNVPTQEITSYAETDGLQDVKSMVVKLPYDNTTKLDSDDGALSLVETGSIRSIAGAQLLLSRYRFQLLIGAILLIGIFIYSPSLHGGYFADDYAFQFNSQQLTIETVMRPLNGYAWRPVETFFLASLQHWYGLNPVPIHLAYLFMHCMFSVMVLRYMLQRGFPVSSAIIAFSIMMLSQANTHAVASIDTLSQLTSTMAGYACLVMYMRFLGSDRRIRWYGIAVFLFVVAITCKETGLFVVPCISLVLLNTWVKNNGNHWRRKMKDMVSVVPFAGIAIAFMEIRNLLGLQKAYFGSGRYNLDIRFNVVRNFIYSLFQAIQPHSSATLYTDIAYGRWIPVALVLVTIGLIISISFKGLTVKRNQRFTMNVMILLPATMFPVLLLNHLSELYVYTMMPLCAILIGLGTGTSLEQERSPIRRVLFITVVTGFLLWNCCSTYAKCTLLNNNGVQAEHLLQKMERVFPMIPYNGKLVLINPEPNERTEYSIFKRTGFRLFEDGAMILNRKAGRSDFTTVITTEKDLAAVDTTNALLVWYVQGNIVTKSDYWCLK